jgi:DNA-binding response OmpR family regulator
MLNTMTNAAPKVLIIEDDQLLGELLKETLKKSQYEVEWAEDGVRGMQQIKEFQPDLILLDIAMPRMDGYEVLSAKAKDATMKDIPVIIISNSGEPVEISRVLPLGVTDYLVKVQLTPEEVLEKVRSQFARGTPSAPATGGQPATSLLKGRKILWVEDDDFLIGLIARRISKEQSDLITSRKGGDVVALAEKEAPDIIMLDILMPDMDGLEILAHIKANEKTRDIPVIMFSNLDDETKIAECQKLGAAGFFVKAKVDLDEIINEIVRALPARAKQEG